MDWECELPTEDMPQEYFTRRPNTTKSDVDNLNRDNMSIVIVYTDLRTMPSKLLRFDLEWQPELSAFQMIERILGKTVANEIETNLKNNSNEIIVSWYNKSTDTISEIGGIGTLEWIIQENTVLTINYENKSTTQQQIDESIEWTLAQGI